MGTRMKFPGRVQERQEFAATLAEKRATRTDTQQLAHLDATLGAGQGAVKERARLAARISNSRAAKPAKTVTEE
jgi:hypothetical protein